MEPMEIEESLVLITLNSQSIRNAMETKLEDKFCPEQMQILLNQFTTNVSSYERLRQEGNLGPDEPDGALLEIHKSEGVEEAALILAGCKIAYEQLLDTSSDHMSHQKLSNRWSKFPQISNPIFHQAGQLLGFISEASSLLYRISFNRTLPGNSSNYSTTHQAKLDSYLSQLQQLQLSILKKFSLLVVSQPSPVIATGSPHNFSLKFVPLPGVMPSVNFVIKTYLVHENAVVDIQTNDTILNNIETLLVVETPSGIPVSSEIRSRPRNNHQTVGKIFLDGIGHCNGVHTEENSASSRPTTRQRSSQLENSFANVSGEIFQNLNGHWFSNQSCCCFNRRLVVKEKPNLPNIGATAKFCLLFVLEFELYGNVHKAWTFSLPFCVTTNSSQYEKVWLPMVWYEVVAEHKKGMLDLQVAKEAPWPKIKQVFIETSNILTGKLLDDDQLEFLREKTLKLTRDESQISLFGTTVWKYFYACLSVVKIGSHFNSLWLKNEIVGFISEDKAATTLGKKFNTSRGSTVGSFIIRFSEKCPGGLTFVFITTVEGKIIVSKLEPLDVSHKNSMKECTEALLNKLDSIDEYTKTASLVSLFPENKDKTVVFEKFYTYAKKKKPIRNFTKWGYVTAKPTHNIASSKNLWDQVLGIFRTKAS